MRARVATTLWSLEDVVRMGDSTKTLHTIALVTPSMSSAALVLLEHAQFIRASAARTRQLANETTMPEVAEQLIRFAAELEHRALELEKRAASIAKTVARTRKRDRKSTRLNSSHQIISYAVFC